jgi:hypothetical protein
METGTDRGNDMAATNFKTENNTFQKLIGSGLTYCVPRFQHDYSWSSEEWEDPWTDLLATLKAGGELSRLPARALEQPAKLCPAGRLVQDDLRTSEHARDSISVIAGDGRRS